MMMLKGIFKMNEFSYLSALPRRVRVEISKLMALRSLTENSISELHLRAGDAISTLYALEKRYALTSKVSEGELAACVELLCEGSIYSHLDTIKEGYIVARGGVRVGICSRVRYAKDNPAPLGEISSLTFRIPTEDVKYNESLLSLFEGSERGMLIFSPVRYGKTSALRALASMLSYGRGAREVAVIDERGEFSALNTRARSIDILTGEKKGRGIEIALRTLSPDVIIIDELSGRDECLSILDFMRGGTRVIASAHAKTVNDLYTREGVGSLISRGVFDTLVGIEIANGERIYKKYD